MEPTLSLPWIVTLVPLIAAAALGFIRNPATGALVNQGASLLAFLFTLLLPLDTESGGLWLAPDHLGIHFAILTSFIGVCAALMSGPYIRIEMETGRMTEARVRAYHALFQAFLGFLLLALLADNAGLTWIAIEAATLSCVLVVGLAGTPRAVEASWRFFIICGVGIALALFGTIVLYLAASTAVGTGFAAMSWRTITLAAPRCNGLVLNLAFVFLLLGYGTKAALAPLHAWMPGAHAEGPTPVSAVLSGSLLNVAICVILRTRHILAANSGAISPNGALLVLGLVSVLLGGISLWRRADAKRFFAFSTMEQSGLAVFAFGVGAPVAGLLHLTLHTMAKAALYQCLGHAAQRKGGQSFSEIKGLIASDRALGLCLAASIIAVAALPPFGLIASLFLILSATAAKMPWLALPLLIGIGTGAVALIHRMQTLCLGKATPSKFPQVSLITLLPVIVPLGLTIILGLAMPGPIATWFTQIAAEISPPGISP
jgi:hydrogenase-4 component F